ncbi:MAG: sensor domain-containing diguanylate cyclase [Candidatus Omnitrophica bacterium]|nr:sensor domain-containing diguanylate cyclase [Candidatus Omnitrophota bacterium]
MMYKIGIAMQSTLRLDEILYVILTCVTAHEGMGFNRAMVFLVNEKDNILEGRIAIGPDTGEDAHRIWNYIQKEQKTLSELLSAYQDFRRRDNSHLNTLVKSIRLPLKKSSGILAKTVIEKKTFEIFTQESLRQIKKNDPVRALFNMDLFLSVPLIARNTVVGVMLVDNFFSKAPITADDTWKLSMFATQAALAIDNSKEFEKTLFLSNTDRLTELWNYGYFQHLLAEETKRAGRFNRSLSLLMLDIDKFKNFNDTYGHTTGDRLLQELALILKKTCRDVDWVARYGGEEFAVILPETNKEKAHASAERIRYTVEHTPFIFSKNEPPSRVTVSIGVASFPQDTTAKEFLVKYADKALYAAKSIGRNRVCMFSKELL